MSRKTIRKSFCECHFLQQEKMEYSAQYLNRITIILEEMFERGASTGQINQNISVKHASDAFGAVLDELFVEMLYVGSEGKTETLVEYIMEQFAGW